MNHKRYTRVVVYVSLNELTIKGTLMKIRKSCDTFVFISKIVSHRLYIVHFRYAKCMFTNMQKQ